MGNAIIPLWLNGACGMQSFVVACADVAPAEWCRSREAVLNGVLTKQKRKTNHLMRHTSALRSVSVNAFVQTFGDEKCAVRS